MNTKEFDLENELRLQAKKFSVEVPRDLSRAITAAITSAAAEELQGAASYQMDISSPSAGHSSAADARSARGGDWGWAGFAGAVRRHWALWGGIGGAVAAAVVGAFVLRAPANQTDARLDAAALAQELRAVPQRFMASLDAPPAGEDPLHEEATALTGSAKSALGFLAYNFLPVTSG